MTQFSAFLLKQNMFRLLDDPWFPQGFESAWFLDLGGAYITLVDVEVLPSLASRCALQLVWGLLVVR